MKDELQQLIRKLDSKEHLDWLPEMRLGKPAYEHLLTNLQGEKLNRNQTANALHGLFRLRSHGQESDVFSLMKLFATNSEINVRSQAVKLLIGMVKLHNQQAPFTVGECSESIKKGITLGLDKDTAALAKRFLDKQN